MYCQAELSLQLGTDFIKIGNLFNVHIDVPDSFLASNPPFYFRKKNSHSTENSKEKMSLIISFIPRHNFVSIES